MDREVGRGEDDRERARERRRDRGAGRRPRLRPEDEGRRAPRGQPRRSRRRVRSTDRRVRLLFLGAIAYALSTLVGAAGERRGLGRRLEIDTVKRRTLSLYDQGCFWYDAIPAMPDDRLALLRTAYDECVREQALLRDVFGLP
ncbi:MAG: hypothetical protein OZ921_10285 [Sorangiineae bacterium]|nr:hypothetical protein [Polyangiaceae bacterium]MEB2322894.1 hypothetical protein [Sorangiineae bacterium]